MKKLLLACMVFAGCASAPVRDPANVSLETVSARLDYAGLAQEIEAYRSQASRELKKYPRRRAKVLAASREYLLATIKEKIVPAWLGTNWSFHGISEKPGEGEIACGYFVSTVLRDAGFKFHRNRLGQQTSPYILQTFLPKAKAQTSAGLTIDQFLEKIRPEGDGLYIVGLDTHVGFLLLEKGQESFIHSSYYQRNKFVVAENPRGANPLADSKWRMAGKILDDAMVEKWIRGQEFRVVTPAPKPPPP
jgi:hypothetical protein